MFENQPKASYHSGFISIIGRPNVGKSTLLNTILGEKIAITTPKPQTTRNRILGVKHFENGQIVFLDTPGFHRAKGGLNQYMLSKASEAISDADLNYLMVEGSPGFVERTDLGEGNRVILEQLEKAEKPVFLLINKVDLVQKEKLLPFIDRMKNLYDFNEILPISARTGDGVEELIRLSYPLLPEGPPYYPDDIVTDRTLRFLASEIIREKAMMLLQQEIPYSLGIEIEQFLELDEGNRFHITANVIVERDSQKGIVIGKGGSMLSRIGIQSREEMESWFEKSVGLKLLVRVRKDWTRDPKFLKELGYK